MAGPGRRTYGEGAHRRRQGEPEPDARGEDTPRRSRSPEARAEDDTSGRGMTAGGGVHEVGEEEDDSVLGEHAGLWAAA